MKRALPLHIAALLLVGVLAVWIAASDVPASEPAAHAPAVTSDSGYPAPRVDPSVPPQEPAPTF
jgi:hypothetical protein